MGVGYPDEIERVRPHGRRHDGLRHPTRAARHGLLFTSEGRLNIKGKSYAEDQSPRPQLRQCMVCRRYSRAYLRHLMQTGEALSATLNSIHNLASCSACAPACPAAEPSCPQPSLKQLLD
jgi:queuine tRNA-ribosyltransferase